LIAAEEDESELYDGPVPGTSNVRPLFREPIREVEPRQEPEPPRDKQYVVALTLALDVLSYRLLLLLAIIASAGLFAGAVLWPDPWRLGAAAAFSVIVTLPAIFFYARRP